MKIHVRVKSIEDKIAEYVENHSVEIYVDYRDELSDKQVDEILKGNADEVRDQICMDCYDDDETYYWKEMCEELGCTQDDVDDWFADGDGFGPCHELTDSDWNQLLRNTNVCIIAKVADAEWNFNNWAYGDTITYADTVDGKGLKTTLKILGINPLEFLKLKTGGGMTSGEGHFKGWFPDLPERKAKVEPKELWDNLCTPYDGILTFCLGNLEEVMKVVESDSKNIVFEKGTNIVMYDFWNGAGITEAQLIDDLTIPRKMVQFRNDGTNKFGIQACYGFCHSVWEKGGVRNEK